MAAVWEHSKQGGSRLLILLAVASYCDHTGSWRADLATLQRRSRLQRRRVQQVLDELVADGELTVEPGNGRGHGSLYRLQEKGAPSCTLSRSADAERVHEGAPFSAEPEERVQVTAPFSPSFPPTPPLSTPNSSLRSSFSHSGGELQRPERPLSGPQQAVAKINGLLGEAGVPLPAPSQIAGWVKALGGEAPLAELVAELIEGGLATKKRPDAYVHSVVMDRATAGGGRAARPGRRSPHAAGADDQRRRQAQLLLREAAE